MGLRESILNSTAVSLKVEPITFMGERVYVRELTSRQRSVVETSRFDMTNPKKPKFDMVNERSLVIRLGTYQGPTQSEWAAMDDAARVAAFKDAKPVFAKGDELYLDKLPGSETDRLYSKIFELSGMQTGADEDAEKNFVPTKEGTSSTS